MVQSVFKRVLNVILSFALVLSMLPMAVFAAGPATNDCQIGDVWYAVNQSGEEGTFFDEALTTAENGRVQASKWLSATNTENSLQVNLKVVTTEEISSIEIAPDAAVVLVMDVSNSMGWDQDGSGFHKQDVSSKTSLYTRSASGTYSKVSRPSAGVQYYVKIKDTSTYSLLYTASGTSFNASYTPAVYPYSSETYYVLRTQDSGAQGGDYANLVDQRITKARAAATDFVDHYVTDAGNALRYVSVVEFATNADVVSGWVDANSGSSLTSVKNSIASVSLPTNAQYGATNMEGGLALAKLLLQQDTVSQIENLYVVLLSDGAPTAQIDGRASLAQGAIGDGSKDNNSDAQAAASVASDIRGLGASLYGICYTAADSICYGTTTVESFIRGSICSANSYYNAYSDESLQLAFDKINVSIQQQLNPWKLSAPMGEYFDFVRVLPNYRNASYDEASDTLIWDLTQEQPTDTYSATVNGITTHVYEYTMAYTIELKPSTEGFVEDQLYCVSGNTVLTYRLTNSTMARTSSVTVTDGSMDVRVPTAKGFLGDLNFVKKAAGTGALLEGASFVLKQGGVELATASSGTDGSVSFTGLTNGSYTVLETEAPAGYQRSEKAWTVNVSYGETSVTDDAGTSVSTPLVWENAPTKDNIKKSITVNKDWVTTDGASLPDSISVALYRNGEATGQTGTLSSPDWTVTFTGLRSYDDEETLYSYSVRETSALNAYEAVSDPLTVTEEGNSVITLTNTLKQEYTQFAVTKVWAGDSENAYQTRPESITFRLTGTVGDSSVVTRSQTTGAGSGWNYTFTELPKYSYSDGKAFEIQYSVTEDALTNYSSTVTPVSGGAVVENHLTTDNFTKDITVVKTWQHPAGTSVPTVNVTLYAGSTVVDTKALSGSSVTFTDLPVFAADGSLIVYSARDDVSGYTATCGAENPGGCADGTISLNNRINQEELEISTNKSWVDNGNAYGTRPATLTYDLYQNGVLLDTKTTDPSAADPWNVTWSGLDRYDYQSDGTVIENSYSVAEHSTGLYVTTVGTASTEITNTLTDTRDISVTKVWEGDAELENLRPDSVTFVLYADGVENSRRTLNVSGGETQVAWNSLAKYAGGVLINYTVVELSVGGYSSVVTGSMDSGFIATNTLTTGFSVSGAKIWADGGNVENTRPESVLVTLYADGEQVAQQTVSGTGDSWTFTFADLPQYRYELSADRPEDAAEPVYDEIPIDYTVDENDLSGLGYVKSVDQTTHILTNTYDMTSFRVSVDLSKTWVDGNNALSLRPETVAFTLRGSNGSDYPLTLSADSWSGSFTDLPKYLADGHTPVQYTLSESTVDGYSSAVTGSQTAGFTVTNTLNQQYVRRSVTKVWVGDVKLDGTIRDSRPGSVTIELYASNAAEKVDTLTLTPNAQGAWEGAFENLPRYVITAEAVVEIQYTLAEQAVSGYTGEINQDTGVVTNTLLQDYLDVPVTKTWVGDNDPDGAVRASRPASIELTLTGTAEGYTKTYTASVTGDSTATWSYIFTDLPKYTGDGSSSEQITYALTETPVAGYDSTVTGDQTGFSVVNTLRQQYIDIPVSKIWDDPAGYSPTRPESITLHLWADGTEIDSVEVTPTVNAQGVEDWSCVFRDLPAYSNDQTKTEIVYTVTEDAVSGYRTVITGDSTGLYVTNTWTQEYITVPVRKVWVDNADDAQRRPQEITLYLIADGDTEHPVRTAQMQPTEAGSWTYEFTVVEKYSNPNDPPEQRHEIEYTVTEAAVEKYVGVGEWLEGEYVLTNTFQHYTYQVNFHYTNRDTGVEEIVQGSPVEGTYGQVVEVDPVDYTLYKEVEYTYLSATPGLTVALSVPYNLYVIDVYYEYAPQATEHTLTVKYLDVNTQGELAPVYSVTQPAGLKYNVEYQLAKQIANYTQVKIVGPSSTEGYLNEDLEFIVYYDKSVTPTPTPTSTPTPTPTSTPTPRPTSSPTPRPTSTPIVTVTPPSTVTPTVPVTPITTPRITPNSTPTLAPTTPRVTVTTTPVAPTPTVVIIDDDVPLGRLPVTGSSASVAVVQLGLPDSVYGLSRKRRII